MVRILKNVFMRSLETAHQIRNEGGMYTYVKQRWTKYKSSTHPQRHMQIILEFGFLIPGAIMLLVLIMIYWRWPRKPFKLYKGYREWQEQIKKAKKSKDPRHPLNRWWRE